jgi:putative riboflavin transport system permease protein
MRIAPKASDRSHFPKSLARHRVWILLASLILFLLIWSLAVPLFHLPAFILPTPLQVASRMGTAISDGSLLYHTAATLLEVLLGMFFGIGAALLLGYALAKSRLLENLLSPYIVASQAIPIVAIAPLLVIWFGPGLTSKALICALIVFFPVLVNTLVGLRNVPENLRDLMHSMRADRVQTLRYLEIPAALPLVLGGLRIGATLAVIGAVVGEFVGSDRGLGFLINLARGQYDTALVFGTVFTLVLLALVLYGLVAALERRFLRWQRRS